MNKREMLLEILGGLVVALSAFFIFLGMMLLP